MRKTLKSIEYAISGIVLASKQRNFWIAVVSGLVVLLLAYWLDVEEYEWLLLIFMIGNIFTAELLNSSIEDLSDKQKQMGLKYKDAGPARDIAAGAVFIQVVVSVIIGIAIFLPKLIEKLFAL